MILGVLLSLCGCGSRPTSGLPTGGLLLKDGLGREVRLAAPARRIISLSPANTELLFAVGAGAHVIGVTTECNYPPEARERDKIGGFTPNTMSLEKLLGLAPDLVVGQGTQRMHQPIAEILQPHGVPVLLLDAAGVEDVFRNLRLLGEATGNQVRAAEIVADLEKRLEAVRTRVGVRPREQRPRVFYQVWDQPLMTAGKGTFTSQLIDLAGGVNIFDDLAQQYPQISEEEVVRRNPGLIVAPGHGILQTRREQILSRPGWQGVEAIRTKRIAFVDEDLVSRPGPRVVAGLEQIADILHSPEK